MTYAEEIEFRSGIEKLIIDKMNEAQDWSLLGKIGRYFVYDAERLQEAKGENNDR
jgi:hypothetical protein